MIYDLVSTKRFLDLPNQDAIPISLVLDVEGEAVPALPDQCLTSSRRGSSDAIHRLRTS